MQEKDIKFEIIKKIAQTDFRSKEIKDISKFEASSPPSVFIGSKLKYPLVNVGILSPLEKEKYAWIYDSPKYWADENFTINDVIRLRWNLLNSRFQTRVKDRRTNKKFVDLSKDIAIASRPVDVEIELKNKMRIGREKDRILTPRGMRASLKMARITGNVKVDRKLDKVMSDEIKATEGMETLYKDKFDEYALSQILSVGVLGLEKDKKLVPTRWSITAVDDTLGKMLLKKIRDYKWIQDYELFHGQFLGNCYLVLLFPGVWSYELFELYLPGSSWNPSKELKAATDYEGYGGRKTYASATAGGYYAARLPILQYLNKIKRQASVLAIRVETPSYWAALGVWVVRESVRKAMSKPGLKFSKMDELLESSTKIGMIKFGYDNTQILGRSRLLEQIQTQKNLKEWF